MDRISAAMEWSGGSASSSSEEPSTSSSSPAKSGLRPVHPKATAPKWPGVFERIAGISGIAGPSRQELGWGAQARSVVVALGKEVARARGTDGKWRSAMSLDDLSPVRH
jgi:hypothetical protein